LIAGVKLTPRLKDVSKCKGNRRVKEPSGRSPPPARLVGLIHRGAPERRSLEETGTDTENANEPMDAVGVMLLEFGPLMTAPDFIFISSIFARLFELSLAKKKLYVPLLPTDGKEIAF